MGPEIVFLAQLALWVLIVGLLCYLIKLGMDYFGFPEPARKVIYVLVIIVLLISLLNMAGIPVFRR